MIKKLLIFLAHVFSFTFIYGQCPNTELFDLDLTVASSEPEWVNCIDNASDPDDFNLELISPNDILNYTIDWGDGSALESGASWLAGAVISHNYTDLGEFIVTLTEVQNGCSGGLTGTFISDRKPGATAQPPTNNANGCVPHSLTFLNQSTNISEFTEFVWDWGDGTTTVVSNLTDAGAVGVPIDHIFLPGVSGCGMQVQLTARSLCDTSFVIYGPYDFYDIDTTAVGASNVQLCVGDTVTFTDQTQYNCIPGTRRIRWDLSDFGGGVTPWVPAVPANRTQDFFIDGPIGSTFDIELQDSNFCGVNESVVTVEIIAPPVADPSVVNNELCEGDDAQFLNSSTGGANSFLWTFGDGTDFSISSPSQVNHTYSDSGSFEIQLIADVAGSLMCSDTATVDVTVKPTPDISFTSSQSTGCDTLISELVNTTPDLINWSWDLGSGEESFNLNTVEAVFEDKGYYIVSLKGENDFFCEATGTDTLVVLPEPTISFNDDSLCFGEEYITINNSSLNEFPTGGLIVERFLNLNNSNSINDLLNNSDYPNSPDETFIINEFDVPNSTVLNAGDRIQAFIKPEVTGLYKFFVSGDDDALLYLSTDESPDNKVEIASVPSFTSYQQWGKHASQQSDFIQLDSGAYYYIEAVGKSSAGGFHLSVGWQLPDGQLERPIPGNYLTPFFDGLVVKNWEWNFGDGSPLINAKDTTHVFTGSGDFNVVLSASTGVCDSKDSIVISVAEEIDSNLVFLDTSGCGPLELSIIDSSNVISLNYSFGDGNQDSIGHVLGDTVVHTYFNNTEEARFFNFSATLFSDFGCDAVVDQLIEVFPTPGSNVILDLPTPPCAPFDLNVYNEEFDNTWSYEWRYGDSLIAGDSSVLVSIANQSTSLRFDTLSLLIQNTTGCDSYVEEVFSVFPEPNYSLTVEPDSGCSPLSVEFSLNETAQSYLWDFGDGDFSNVARPIHEYSVSSQDTITYFPTVFVNSPFSCRDTLTSSVFVQKEISAGFIASPQVQTYPDTSIQFISLNLGPVQDTIWMIDDSLYIGELSSFEFDSVGEHIISQTVRNQFCSDVFIDTILILPPVPIVDFQGGGVACPFTEFTFTNNSLFATDYVWDFGDGNTSTEDNPTHLYDSIGVFDVKLIASGLGGIDSVTVFQAVNIIAKPVSEITVFNDSIYQPDSLFEFIDVSTGDITFKTWVSGDGDTLTDLSNRVDFSYNVTGVYMASLIVGNSTENCIDTSTVEFTLLPPLPRASFSGGDTACAPLTVSFTNETENALFYRWDFGDGTESFEIDPSHTYDSVGVYNVKLVAINLLGEDSTVSSGVVEVLPYPEASFTVLDDTLVYLDSVFTIINTSTGNVTESLWTYEEVSDSVINANSFDLPLSQIGENVVELEVLNEFENCTSTFIDTLIILPAVPISSFSAEGEGCLPMTVEFTNESQYGTEYLWKFGDGDTSSLPNPTHVYNVLGAFNVTLTVTGPGGVDSVTIFNVAQTSVPPVSEFSVFNDSIYQPDSVFTFVDQSSGLITNKTWISGDGDTLLNAGSPADLIYNIPDKYTVLFIVGNDLPNCQDTSSVDITLFPPLPIASFIGADTSCAPLTIDFENTSENALFYRWDFGDGTESFARNPSHTYDSVGVYNVKLVATNIQGEDSLISSGVIQVLEKPEPSFEIVNDMLIYPDTVFSIINNSAGDVTLSKWTYNAVEDTVINSSGFEIPISVSGETILNLEVSNEFENCESQFSDTLLIEPPLPIADFTGNASGCIPVSVEFTNETQFGETYLWSFGDGSFSREENPTYTYFTAGTYNVTLVATNFTGSDSIIKTNIVEVYNNPSALFVTNPDPELELVAPIDVFFNNQSLNATEYIWDFGDGAFSTDEKPLHEYAEEGEFMTSLVALNEFGCRDSFELETPLIVVDGGLFVVPNAFSPNLDQPSANGDISEGINNNDIFFPKIKGDVVEYKLFIYDRWGELLFYTEDHNIGWDGYYKGKLSKQDVYVYRLEIQFETGDSDILIGDFSLIR